MPLLLIAFSSFITLVCSYHPMLMVVILTVEAPKRRREGQERKEERETAKEERKGEDRKSVV